ncbi:unnamed protein product [Paramecium primaurelia]|uniref:Uncharacterized protein n=1 Tax=Paramecium primaurelia TaxID=5886 RepID=A0A8S1N9P3_PARPR|nr:unnamed protein product [Paramecium primaurelia]
MNQDVVDIYQNKNNQFTLFPSHEKLKLAYSILQSCIILNTSIKLQFLNQILYHI